MRAVLQRVTEASVVVNSKTVASAKEGLLVLIGLHPEDGEKDIEYIINKILNARIFNDKDDIMNLSVQEIGGEVIVVSQFTLYGDLRKGRRPSYSNAMPSVEANLFFTKFVKSFKLKYDKIQTGLFGEDMKVSLTNSGPVTIILDSFKNF